MSQKELQRVSVISSCVKGDMACARAAELVQLDGSPHDWLEGRGPRLTALGLQDDATGKILAAQFFPSETAVGYLGLLRQLLRHHGTPLAFYGDHSGIFVRNDDSWSVEEQLAGKRQPTQFGRALEQLGIPFIAARSPQAKGRVERACSRTSSPANSAWLRPAIWIPPMQCSAFPRRLQPPLCPPAPSDPDRVASSSRKSRPHLLLRSPARRQQRQHRAVGRPALSNPQQGQRFSFAGAKVHLYQALDGRVSLYYGDTKLQITLASPG